MENIVAIVGRPNVGKSTLFNRLTGSKTAIVSPVSGVTRDRNYGEVEWTGKRFFLIDTGGFVPDSDELFEKAINKQVKAALEEADKIIFAVDSTVGIHPVDYDIAELLRRFAGDKEVFLAVNKADNLDREEQLASEFYSLGLGEPFAISALSGRNTADLLDAVVKDIEDTEEKEDNRIKFAIIGKPNAGKSSIVNAILNEERNIVTDVPGTTRDSIDSVIKHYGEEIVLIDTAGLRKKTKVTEALEFYSTVRTYKAIQRCDVAILVIDATLLTEYLDKSSNHAWAPFKVDRQDTRIIDDVVQLKKGLLIVVNKWDLVEKQTNTAKIIEDKIKEHLKSYNFLKIIFISAKSKQRIHKIVEDAKIVYEERKKVIKTSELNDVLQKEIKQRPPHSRSGREVKINYITQVKSAPPVFAFFANEPKMLTDNYKRFLERKIYQHFGFEGVPVTLVFKSKNKSE